VLICSQSLSAVSPYLQPISICSQSLSAVNLCLQVCSKCLSAPSIYLQSVFICSHSLSAVSFYPQPVITCSQSSFLFQFGESQKLKLARMLKSTVMVRVGEGWQALDKFLVMNDSCGGKNTS